VANRLLILLRALALRCPHCGGGGNFRHWFAMKERCPSCGLSLATGNRVGANLLNLVAAELLLMAAIVTVVVRSWPSPPWDVLQVAAPLLMLVTPLLLYPFSKMLFVAIDVALHRIENEPRDER
jgi:uncharacterized protein (DUF983 family)